MIMTVPRVYRIATLDHFRLGWKPPAGPLLRGMIPVLAQGIDECADFTGR